MEPLEARDISPKIKGGHVEMNDEGNPIFVYDEVEDDGENARPLTKSEQKNAEEVEESDTFDDNTKHNV